MGNENNTTVEHHSFLKASGAQEFFGKLDYKLKDGFHFSNVEGQQDLFKFIAANEGSLAAYYECFFRLRLDNGGEGTDKYYHLDFNGLTRGEVDADHRYFLRNEYIIVGLVLYKVIFIDKNFELSSVRIFQETIKRDYEELRPDLYRLLIKAKHESASQLHDDRLDEMILDALKEFEKIGWVFLDGDEFELFPAFHRIHKLFGEYINDIDNIVKKGTKE